MVTPPTFRSRGALPLEDFDYVHPPDAVALTPLPRGQARLLVTPAGPVGAAIEECRTGDLPDLLESGDLVVVNDTRVLPARLHGRRPGGGRAEILLLEPDFTASPGVGSPWKAIVRPGVRLPPGSVVTLPDGAIVRVEGRLDEEGLRLVRLPVEAGQEPSWLRDRGEMPLPPYIRRAVQDFDTAAYQTVYARVDGSVAAPTAGLHLTEEFAARCAARGVRVVAVTLHVGLGTFRPVAVDDAVQHRMHEENYSLGNEAANALRETTTRGGRVLAVGTTTLRVLESVWRIANAWEAMEGRTGLFVHPLDPPRAPVHGLFTNFHLPRSTLLLLVASWLEHPERWREVYTQAVSRGFRLFSYGDAMLSWRDPTQIDRVPWNG